MTERVDTIVIGGGMSGLPMGLRAARHGPTVLIEADRLGGTCLNRGCVPTKTMIHSAKIAHLIRQAPRFGVHVDGAPLVALGEVVDRKDEVVDSIVSGSYRAAERAENFALVEGWARFTGPKRVEVNGSFLEADRVVINTGARPTVPDLPGLADVPSLDSTTALDVREVPEHLVVLGGGFVGCEFAQMYRRFGSKVTMFQRAARLLPTEDPKVSEVIETVFQREGITVRTETTIDGVTGTEGALEVDLGSEHISATHLLVAVGRTPNTDALGIEEAGVETDELGFVKVDSSYETSAPGTYAIGDVIGPPMFTHSGRDDALLLYRHLFRGEDISWKARMVPHAVFTDPEVASVGLTEAEARNRFDEDVSVGVEPFRRVARARAIGETDGFVKVIAGPERVLVGATIVGPDAGNLIHEVVVTATAGLPVNALRDAMHIHPTLAEAVNAAAGGVHRPVSG